MRNTDNGVIGSDQTAVMARLALDELIDQLLHSNALSLKLTANPLVADRAWHLTENTCIRAFSADDPQAKKACAPRAVHSLSVLACRPALASGCQSVSSAAFRDQKLHRV
ncbi:spermidine/putrescine ABC transporter [Klebsiella pneumoniae]|uniref:Spermidine/putrescine ABC transporter n=1 Tax=Klebsiella pneumoniae TaxID=573 RepID=A0A377TT30_KLEPN|nr:spermidine/putrescine ABC transporter [Klebsiella pneumoniae]